MRTSVAILVLLIAGAACSDNPAAPTRFLIRVDSVTAPTEVVAGVDFTATFHGTVGGSNCYSLKRVDRELFRNATDLVFVGEKCVSGGGYAIVIPLGHSELIRAPYQGTYTIRVRQPDGSLLEKGVAVR